MPGLVVTDQEKRRWPGRWLRDDEFWKGIAVQTIGTLLAAFIVTVVAVIIGQQEFSASVRYYALFAVIYSVFAAVVAVVLLLLLFSMIDDETMKQFKRPALWRVIIFVLAFVLVSLYPIVWHGLSNALTHFTGFKP